MLRAYVPGVCSFLMDEDTLLPHRSLWESKERRVLHDLPLLDDDEKAFHYDLRCDRFAVACVWSSRSASSSRA